jgi:peptidoglycan/LPS O-acetylase OafA/YrhL
VQFFFRQLSHAWRSPLVFAVPYVLTAAGHQAVVIFFVLSGFLIGGTIRHAFDRGQWSWASYLTHRLVRLWVVLLPGLMLCLLWDTLGGSAGTDTAITLIGNMFFLQGVIVPAFGSDGPLWSLANEFWYYVLFPLGLTAVLPSTRPRTRLVTAALFLLLCLWLRTTLLPLFPIWLLGAVVLIVPRPRLSSALRWLAVAAYVPIVYLCSYVAM